MIPILTKTWTKYNGLKTWQQILLFVPIVAFAILALVLVFMQPKSYKDKYRDAVKREKKQVDKNIEENKEEQKRLEALDKKIVERQKKIKKKIEENYERTKILTEDIDDAVSNNDSDKLKRIHEGLNNRAKSRRR